MLWKHAQTAMEKLMSGYYEGETQPASPEELLEMGRDPLRPWGGPWWLQPPVVPRWADEAHGKDTSYSHSWKHNIYVLIHMQPMRHIIL